MHFETPTSWERRTHFPTETWLSTTRVHRLKTSCSGCQCTSTRCWVCAAQLLHIERNWWGSPWTKEKEVRRLQEGRHILTPLHIIIIANLSSFFSHFFFSSLHFTSPHFSDVCRSSVSSSSNYSCPCCDRSMDESEKNTFDAKVSKKTKWIMKWLLKWL